MSEYVIGVDIGTQSTKALLTDARGRIVAHCVDHDSASTMTNLDSVCR